MSSEKTKTKQESATPEIPDEATPELEEATSELEEATSEPEEAIETPESIAPHYGQLGFQKLFVFDKQRTPGDGTYSFVAIPTKDLEGQIIRLVFQNGIPSEVGVNGLSMETVLRACLNRLRSFQKGEFPCEENAVAINSINVALSSLCKRSKDREDRAVEGKLKV